MKDYKKTLNLPETRFPMRGELIKIEPKILKNWYKNKLYKMIRVTKKGKKIFILHDGPPYANGSIHIGHSVNKIIKDIIIKSKGMSGFDSPYIPGWDCHGLPIELQVEKIYGKYNYEKRKEPWFRKKCREYAAYQIKNQKNEFIRLGVLGDWENPYTTMDFQTEANIIRVLGKMISHDHLIQGVKPVHWCTNCNSSLAEAEVEHLKKISPSIDILFSATHAVLVCSKFHLINFNKIISLVIWTTTPWTLPANRAISLNPKSTYQMLQVEKNYLILSKCLVISTMKRNGITKWNVLGNCKGSHLEKLYFQHPFMRFSVPVLLSDYVTLEIGSGAVHIAPGHGPEDFVIGQKYDLEVANPVNVHGCYLSGSDSVLEEKFFLQTNDIIIEILHKKDALLHIENFLHSYPHCWRHKTPIIFRSTPQWFVRIRKTKLQKQTLKAIKSVQWIPNWGKECIKNMVSHRPDWCISRQRSWGVPMSLFVHKNTEKLHPRSVELIEEVAKRVEKEGIQAWWDLKKEEILGVDAKNYVKVLDTLDVWFDSGSTHTSIVDVRPEFYGNSPDLYIEGSDQHRGWFMSSLIISTAIKGKAPYKEVLTHGFTIDANKKKMSKSIGNTITPKEIITKLGGDILRLWIASTDYTGEIAVSDEILKRATDYYRRIRNTVRFFVANLNDFKPNTHSINKKNMVVLDRWAVGRAMEVQKYIEHAYIHYNFHEVVKRIMQFCSVDMGAFYLDIIKDRQYTAKADSIARRSCQTALFHIAEALVRWISPIISFTADEIWNYLPGKRTKFVFTEEWYENLFILAEDENMNDKFWNTIFKVRGEVNKIMEKLRTYKYIGSSLESVVTLYVDNTLSKYLKNLKKELRFVFINSFTHVAPLFSAPVEAKQSELFTNLKILISTTKGKKCLRCWHYTVDIGQIEKYLYICYRCITNVSGYGEKRTFA